MLKANNWQPASPITFTGGGAISTIVEDGQRVLGPFQAMTDLHASVPVGYLPGFALIPAISTGGLAKTTDFGNVGILIATLLWSLNLSGNIAGAGACSADLTGLKDASAEIEIISQVSVDFQEIDLPSPGIVYITKEKVKETLQGAGQITIPVSLTDAKLDEWIEERSREIDTLLPNYEQFPDISILPLAGPTNIYGTPKMIQRACRLLVVADALRYLGLDRHSETGKDITQEADVLRLLGSLARGEIEIPPQEYDYAQLSGESQREAVDPNAEKPIYFSRLTRDDSLGS
jgi:hypothetical protein